VTASTLWLSCGVVGAELRELHRRGAIAGRLLFLDSMLHMRPTELEAALTAALAAAAPDARVVLVYGDCCPRMVELARMFGANRTAVINCAQLLLGRARYREAMRDRAFVLLPEWAARWREVLQNELGLSEEVAGDLLQEHRRELVYIDTGLTEVPRQSLEAFSAYAGLPWRVEVVTLEHLLAGLLNAERAAPQKVPRDQRS
jgi:hypothetical protein